jgi:RHS repeat-associated protein
MDHLGSVREMVSDSGSVVAQYSYSPFGGKTAIVETTASDFGFAGMYWHSRSGLNLTWFRAYNPGLGRWLSRDPIEEIGGLNLYAYVENNPISLIDPSGTDKCDPCAGLTGWALYACRRNNDPCKGYWGWFLDICRHNNPGSEPIMPYDPGMVDISRLETDLVPQDIIDKEIIRRMTAEGDDPETIDNEIKRSRQHRQDALQALRDFYRQQNKLPPVKTIIKH